MKILGLAICLGTVLGTAATVGIQLYFDVPSLLFVLGGAIGFLVMKNNPERHIKNFGQGAVYFGWLGTIVGLVAFTGGGFFVWGDVEKMGPVIAVSVLTILYSYPIKFVTFPFIDD